jgi:hypothetical protein
VPARKFPAGTREGAKTQTHNSADAENRVTAHFTRATDPRGPVVFLLKSHFMGQICQRDKTISFVTKLDSRSYFRTEYL